MGDRVSYLQGLVAGLDPSDLMAVNVFIQQRLSASLPPPAAGAGGGGGGGGGGFPNPLIFAPPVQFAEVAAASSSSSAEAAQPPLRKKAAIPTPDTPLPPPAKTAQAKPKDWEPNKGNSAMRLFDEPSLVDMSYKDFSALVDKLLSGLQVTRIIKGEPQKFNVVQKFTLLYKDEEDASYNTALIVFPRGCMDYCKAALPEIRKEFASAEIYTQSVKRGNWE